MLAIDDGCIGRMHVSEVSFGRCLTNAPEWACCVESLCRYAHVSTGQSARREFVIRILLFSLILVFTIRQIKKIFADATAAPQDVSADAAVVDVDVIVDEPADHQSPR